MEGSMATTAKTQIIAEPGMPQIIVNREFDAPRELLYRVHTDPALLAQWLGPRRLTMVVGHYDVRDGGTWRFVHRDVDGNEYGFHGIYHGTPSPEDGIVRTFEYEGAPGHVSLETLTFVERSDRSNRTLVRANTVFQSVENRDEMVQSGMEEGVNEGMERLDELLARLSR